MHEPTTHVLLVLDNSASMSDVATDTRGGFNGYIESLVKDTEKTYKVTVGIFADRYENMVVGVSPSAVPRLNNSNYRANGYSTSLYDAIGHIIADFERTHAVLGEHDRVLLVVQTDGLDNSSREFSLPAVKALITERQDTEVWNCLYLGAGPDAWAAGGSMGFASGNTINVAHTAKGTQSSYEGLSHTTRSYSRGGSQEEVSGLMRGAVESDD